MGFSRQEYWNGLPFLSLGIFLTQGLNCISCIGTEEGRKGATLLVFSQMLYSY